MLNLIIVNILNDNFIYIQRKKWAILKKRLKTK